MRMVKFLAILALALSAMPAWAQNNAKTLQSFYHKVHTLSANFQQVERGENGNVFQKTSGTFLLSRPDKFRWVYKKPYKQIIVSNGKVFKFYDVGLSQVTIRNIGATLNATPALLLTGGEALTKAFDIKDAGQHDGLTWVRLTPKGDDTNFQSIELGLKNSVPRQMKLHDNLGQTTDIRFSDIKVNPHLSASKFELKVPDNVEVVDGRPGARKTQKSGHGGAVGGASGSTQGP